MDYLEQEGLAEQTILVFSSDHGDMLGRDIRQCLQWKLDRWLSSLKDGIPLRTGTYGTSWVDQQRRAKERII